MVQTVGVADELRVHDGVYRWSVAYKQLSCSSISALWHRLATLKVILFRTGSQ